MCDDWSAMGPKTLRSAIARSLLAIALLVVSSAALARGSATVTVPVDYPTIQSAIDAVLNGTLADGTTIDVLPGTYFENITVVAAPGITAFTVQGVGGPAVTIVDANHNGLPLVILGAFNNSNTTGIVFQGLTLRNGGPASGSTLGGGLHISGAVSLAERLRL